MQNTHAQFAGNVPAQLHHIHPPSRQSANYIDIDAQKQRAENNRRRRSRIIENPPPKDDMNVST